MKYFLDTEFCERGPKHPLELISLAIVSEDGRELYRVNKEFKQRHANQWVKDNVLPNLPQRTAMAPPYGSPRLWAESAVWESRKQIAEAVFRFVTDDDASPEFWGYFSAYDWVVVCQLFGDMSGLPPSFPYYCRDLKQVIDERGLSISQDDSDHNALGDARWVRDTYIDLTPGPANPLGTGPTAHPGAREGREG